MKFDPAAVETLKQQLLSPLPLSEAEELERIVHAKPRYLGPGPWLKLLRELGTSPGKHT